MYALVLGSIWTVIVAIAYVIGVAIRDRHRRFAGPVFAASLVAFIWVVASVLSANSFHGPTPIAGWSNTEQIIRNLFIGPAAFVGLFTPILVASLFSSGLALRQTSAGSWVPRVAACLAFVFAPIGLFVAIYIGCTIAGACF